MFFFFFLFLSCTFLSKFAHVYQVYLLGSKITVDIDCSHEIKRCLLLGRKAMTNLDSVLKCRDIIADKSPKSQSYGFSCNRRTKHDGSRGQEELPHVRGQGHKPGGPHAGRVAAKRSYPMSEDKGGQECQAAMAQERQRRATQVQGQGRRPGGPTPVQGVVAAQAQEGLEALSHVEGQEGWR